jgi:hypothetical protein
MAGLGNVDLPLMQRTVDLSLLKLFSGRVALGLKNLNDEQRGKTPSIPGKESQNAVARERVGTTANGPSGPLGGFLCAHVF